jgi:hypothetical protein
MPQFIKYIDVEFPNLRYYRDGDNIYYYGINEPNKLVKSNLSLNAFNSLIENGGFELENKTEI